MHKHKTKQKEDDIFDSKDTSSSLYIMDDIVETTQYN